MPRLTIDARIGRSIARASGPDSPARCLLKTRPSLLTSPAIWRWRQAKKNAGANRDPTWSKRTVSFGGAWLSHHAAPPAWVPIPMPILTPFSPSRAGIVRLQHRMPPESKQPCFCPFGPENPAQPPRQRQFQPHTTTTSHMPTFDPQRGRSPPIDTNSE